MNLRRMSLLLWPAAFLCALVAVWVPHPTGAYADAGAGAAALVRRVDVTHYPTVTIDVGVTGVGDPTGVDVAEAGAADAGAKVERLSGQDLQVVLVVDTSGSMAGAPMDAAKAAASSFIDRLAMGTRVAVVGFGAQPAVASAMSADRAAAHAALSGLVARGETALYDAVVLAAGQFQGSGGRRELVVLSDGGDTVSHTALPTAVSTVGSAGASLDAVELVTPDVNAGALSALASAGHGQVVPADNPAALGDVYARLAASLTSELRVTFSSSHHGSTAVQMVIHTASGNATAGVTLPLPAAPAAVSTTVPVTTAPTVAPAHRAHQGARAGAGAKAPAWWPLAAGGAAFFFAFLLALSGALGPVQRRARLARLGHRRRAEAEGSTLSRIANRASEKAEEALVSQGRAVSVGRLLERAGIALRPGEFAVLAACGVATALLLGALLFGLFMGLLLAVAAGGLALLVPKVLAGRRKAKFGDQLGDTLQLLSSSLRAGYGLLQATDAVAHEAPAPTCDEFRRVLVETRLGRDLSTSLRAASERVELVDFEWVVQAIDIQREVGGDLAEILDNVGATIRDRNQLRRQVKALTAEGRVSAYVLLALPVVLALLMRAINPEYVAELTRGVGLLLVGISAVLMTVGAVWLIKLCKLVY